MNEQRGGLSGLQMLEPRQSAQSVTADEGPIYVALVSVIGVGDVEASETGRSALNSLDTVSSLLRFRTCVRRSLFSVRSLAFSASSFSSLRRRSAIGILFMDAGGSTFFGTSLLGADLAAGTLVVLVFIGTDLAMVLAISAFFAVGAGFEADLVAVFTTGVADTGGGLTDFVVLVGVVTLVTLTGMDFDGAGFGFSAGGGLVLDDPLIPRGMAIP